MHFTIQKADLAAALTRCAAIAGTRSTMPVLAAVLLEPCAGVMKITATDLETGYHTAVDGIQWMEGSVPQGLFIAVPAKKLHECIKALPGSHVEFKHNAVDQRLTLTAGTVTFTLATVDPEEYPALPEVSGACFDLDAPALVKILDSVAYAQSKDEQKYHLCSVHLKVEANVDDELFLTAAATDGHRLAVDSVSLPGDPREVPADLTKGVIISTKGVTEICKIKTPGVIVLSIAANNLCISTDNEKLYLRLVDGDYPDYNRIIPTGPDQKRIEVKHQALVEALERCRIMTAGKFRRISLVTGDGDILLSSDLVAISGHAEDRVTALVPDEPLTLSVNVESLLATLESMACGVVEISVKDELSVILINPLGTTEPLACIMPMRGE